MPVAEVCAVALVAGQRAAQAEQKIQSVRNWRIRKQNVRKQKVRKKKVQYETTKIRSTGVVASN